jgi:hypothetical protein
MERVVSKIPMVENAHQALNNVYSPLLQKSFVTDSSHQV